MILLVLTLVSFLSIPLESCKFTVTTQYLFTSLNWIEIGTTCSDCDILLNKCYPFIVLRSSMDWVSDSVVDWSVPESKTCPILGRVNLTSHAPVTDDLFVSVIPQSCSPDFEPQHVRISSVLFQNLTEDAEPDLLSATQYTDKLESPIQTDLLLDLSSLSGVSSSLFWAAAGSSLIQLFTPTQSQISCPLEIVDDTPYFYELSSSTLVLLYNGVVSTISPSGNTTIQIEDCLKRISISSDLITKTVFAITADQTTDSITTNSIHHVTAEGDVSKFMDSKDLAITEDNSFVCLGGETESTVSYTSLRFLDIFSIDSVSKQIILLEEITSFQTSYIYLIMNGNTLSTCYRFPSTVSHVSEITSLEEASPGSTPLRLDSLHSLHPSSPHLLGVGSVVVYSPCFGCAWYLLPVSHSSQDGYKLDLDKAGRYVIQSPDSLYYGYFGETIELSKHQLTSTFTPSHLLTIKDREVILTSFFDSDGKVGQNETVVDLMAVSQHVSESSKLEKVLRGTIEKNVKVTVSANLSSSYTRQQLKVYSQPNQHPEVLIENVIPERVYLQFGETYLLEFTFSLSSANLSDLDYLIKESYVGWNVWNGTLLEIRSEKRIDYQNLKVVHSVYLSDVGKANRAPPGEEIVPVGLTVFPSQPSLLSPFHVMLGCKPHQRVLLNLVDTPDLLSSSTSLVIRMQYDTEFFPHFSIEDLVTHMTTPYTGNYTLRILGAGPTVEQIKMWNDQELEKFNKNGGATSVWTWKDTFKQIKWLCRERSPCSNVYPTANEGVPNYCFKIKFSNSELNDTTSYCTFEADLTICVHGLPLSIWQSLASFSIFLTFFLVTLFVMFIKKHSWSTLLEELKIRKIEDEDDVEEEYEMFIRDQKVKERQRASTLRPLGAADKRSSIVNQIRLIQGTESNATTDTRNSLAPYVRGSLAAKRSSHSHRSHH